MILIWFILHYIIAVVIFAIIGVWLELDINIFFWGFVLLVGFYCYRVMTAKIRYQNTSWINKTINKIFEDQKMLDMDEKIISTTLRALNYANNAYNGNENELKDKLFKQFSHNLYSGTKEETKADFPSEDKIEEGVYAILASLIINELEFWNIHSPIWKFEYYSFLLFHFLDKLLELGYYDDEAEMLEIIKSLRFDGWGGYINMLHEREKYLKEYKSYTDIEDDDEIEQEPHSNDEENESEDEYNFPEWEEDFKNELYYETCWIQDEINELEDLVNAKKYKNAIELNKSFNKSFHNYIKDWYINEDYYLITGIAHQETWDKDKADEYFDKYLDNIYISPEILNECEEKGIYHIQDVKLYTLENEIKEKFELKYKWNKKYLLYKKWKKK